MANTEISSEWRELPLAEVLPLKYGKARSDKDGYSRPGTQIYGSNGSFGTFDRALTNGPAVIIGRKGAVGSVHFSGDPCWPIDTAFYTEGDNNIFLPFFSYLLQSVRLDRLDRSTAIPSLSRDDYNRTIVRYPEDVIEQARIVGEIEKQFTRLDAAVASLERVKANLKRYRTAVLGAGCDGRLAMGVEGEKASESGARLLERILGARPSDQATLARGKETSALDLKSTPKLPDGWVWSSVAQLTDPDRTSAYGVLQPGEDIVNGVPFVRVGDINNGKLDTQNLKRISLKVAADYPRTKLRGGELLITLVGAIGRTAIVPRSLAGGNVARAVGVIPLTQLVSSRWVEMWFRNPKKVTEMTSKSHEVARKTLNLEDVRSAAVALPPLAEQHRIVAEVERRLSVVDELEQVVAANLQRASRLRQSILDRAFTGRLVKNESTDSHAAKPAQSKGRRHFLRALLSAEIVHQLHAEPTFGQTKHQKIFHLCEHIAQIAELEVQYHRDAAGPYDNVLIHANESELKKQKWYEEYPREHMGHAYRPLSKAGGHQKYLDRYWADKLDLIRRLIDRMRRWDTERCEIFSTAYAAWNDLLLWGRDPSEDAIVHEILHNWHPSKRRIPEARWRKALEWMKKEGFVPNGFGRPTAVPSK